VELARQALDGTPQEGAFWNTLGVAHYRAGDPKATVAALQKSIQLRRGGDATDWFFLAMAHWQLGERDQASAWYEKAVQSMDQLRGESEELRGFRAEATSFLGR
jgi:tetratricopeptide (TPR) repeat protein